MAVSFSTTKADAALIKQIAERAAQFAETIEAPGTKLDFLMDVQAAHCNGCPLNLEGLLAANNFNFAHDVFGIRGHLDRETGEVGHFLPRYAMPAKAA